MSQCEFGISNAEAFMENLAKDLSILDGVCMFYHIFKCSSKGQPVGILFSTEGQYLLGSYLIPTAATKIENIFFMATNCMNLYMQQTMDISVQKLLLSCLCTIIPNTKYHIYLKIGQGFFPGSSCYKWGVVGHLIIIHKVKPVKLTGQIFFFIHHDEVNQENYTAATIIVHITLYLRFHVAWNQVNHAQTSDCHFCRRMYTVCYLQSSRWHN